MYEPLEITVDSTNQKAQFVTTVGDNDPITIDYTPPVGDGQGYMPLQLLLISLASCAGTSVALLLRRMNKTILKISVDARGMRRETHPTSFENIDLCFRISSKDVSETDVLKAITMSEETICPVWAMLKNNVVITYNYKIAEE